MCEILIFREVCKDLDFVFSLIPTIYFPISDPSLMEARYVFPLDYYSFCLNPLAWITTHMNCVLFICCAGRYGGGCRSNWQGPLGVYHWDRVCPIQKSSRGESRESHNEGRDTVVKEPQDTIIRTLAGQYPLTTTSSLCFCGVFVCSCSRWTGWSSTCWTKCQRWLANMDRYSESERNSVTCCSAALTSLV